MKSIIPNNKVFVKLIIPAAAILLIYILVSLYFTNHFFFNTVINGVNVSLRAHKKAEQIIQNHINDYKLKLIERNGGREQISGQDIGMSYNENISLSKIYKLQNPFLWPGLFTKNQKYDVEDLFSYNDNSFSQIIGSLDCLNNELIEPKNVSFIYSDGSYELLEEEYGNKIDKGRLTAAIREYVLAGKTELNLNKEQCYINPKYTTTSKKTEQTRNLLNKYVSAKITYKFGNKSELVDGNVIQGWLSVDAELDVQISKDEVMEYIKGLSKKYDTAGTTRKFQSSTGRTVEVKGGLYGWKINKKAEVYALIQHISLGEVIEKEPVYSHKALYRGEDDIGKTYVEIDITKQHLWFYKDGQLITHGSVVTGNPSRGNSTVVGTYTIIYKEKDSTLSGPGYDVKVTYWMPFYGNMGIHDASWRSSFGGEIYLSRGTHGCVNAPYQLAKTIYENIEDGTPVVIYKE